MERKELALVVDMYGCPNRCGHCWLGHMENRRMEAGADEWIVNYFRPYFDRIVYYSWLREPDFCDDYRERWERDKRLSVNTAPERFELASFWRLVRDPEYVKFLKEEGVRRVQLTFFGLEGLTDRYVGRRGAFGELLRATEILIENQIAPRWQAFITEENKEELTELLHLAKRMGLKEKCASFQEEFVFFIHAGGCDGENRKLYPIRIQKPHIPEILKPYYLDYDQVLTEKECIERLKGDASHVEYHNEQQIVLNISNTFDAYFNFTHMTEPWKIGNLREEAPKELVRRAVEEDTWALRQAKKISAGELAERYGDGRSERTFSLYDYRAYLLNRYLDDAFAMEQN